MTRYLPMQKVEIALIANVYAVIVYGVATGVPLESQKPRGEQFGRGSAGVTNQIPTQRTPHGTFWGAMRLR
jgi:hypothetical protein